MRYTEARLAKVANDLLEDIDKDTVDFSDNYDGSAPGAVGSSGALSQPAGQRRRRHRRRHGDQHSAAQPGRSDRRLPGVHRQSRHHDRRADRVHSRARFPHCADDPRQRRGRARPTLPDAARSSCAPATRSRKAAATAARSCSPSIPYQVGKAGLVEKIAEAAKDKRIEGISDIRDESNRQGVRVVIELKRDATPEVVLNQLWRHSPAQANFPANMLAIRGGRPETLTLRDFIQSLRRSSASKSSPAAPSSSSTRRATGRTSCSAWWSRSSNLDEVVRDDPRRAQPGRGARAPARQANGRSARSRHT